MICSFERMRVHSLRAMSFVIMPMHLFSFTEKVIDSIASDPIAYKLTHSFYSMILLTRTAENDKIKKIQERAVAIEREG